MEDERDSADIHRSTESDPSGPRSGFKLSTDLRAWMERLNHRRIRHSAIISSQGADEIHGGHATVSKAFLNENDTEIGRATHWTISERTGPRTLFERQWAAEETTEGLKIVAVKKLRIADDTDLERALGLALRETEFLVRLSHPNIVKFEGFVEDLSKDIIWLVFPWADNGNLKDFVASRDWEVPERISLIDDVAKGLEYLHGKEPPICHGDLKSLNVLVNSEHHAVITDFGSARRFTGDDPDIHLGQGQCQPQPFQATFCPSNNTITLTGNKYSLRWAAPELINEDQISLWSDIWALGWIAYEVMTNSIPFQDVQVETVVVARVIQGNLPSVTDEARLSLVRELYSLMTMCWTMNPTGRPTAEYCRKSMDWMPRIIPARGTRSKVSEIPSLELLMELGYMYRRQSDYVNACYQFAEALRISTETHDMQGRVTALFGLAEVHRLQDKYSEAIALWSDALYTLNFIRDRQGRASALCGLADVHRSRSEYNKAIALYSEALHIHADTNDLQSRLPALCDLAEVHRIQNEYSKAVACYSEALRICTTIGDREARRDVLSSLAEVHRLRAEYGEATTLYSEALEICTGIGDRHGRASALWGLAEVHRVQDEYSEAIKLYSEALQILTDIGDSAGRADALYGLAQVHRVRDQYSEAVTLYSEVLQIRTDIGDKKGRASTLLRLAEVHRLRNEYSEAVAFYSDALQIRTDIGDRIGKASALRGLAEVHWLRGEYSKAVALYFEVLQIRTEIGDRKGSAKALLGLGDLHRDQGHYSHAASLYQQAARRFEEIGRADAAADALKDAADVLQLDKLGAPRGLTNPPESAENLMLF